MWQDEFFGILGLDTSTSAKAFQPLKWQRMGIALDYAEENAPDYDMGSEWSVHTRQLVDWTQRVLGSVSIAKITWPENMGTSGWQNDHSDIVAPKSEFDFSTHYTYIHVGNIGLCLYATSPWPHVVQDLRIGKFSYWKEANFQGNNKLCDVFGMRGRLLATHEEQDYDTNDPKSPYRYWMRYDSWNVKPKKGKK